MSEQVGKPRWSWTQPLCTDCWFQHNDKYPMKLIDPDVERCVTCGRQTQSGIYIRIEPGSAFAKFPTLRKD